MPPRFIPPRLNRITPRLGPEYYQSYTMSLPLSTHWRPATCEEVDCPDFINGFVLTVDTSTDLGQKQYYYVTHDKSRKYSMQRLNQYTYKFIYGPGNNPFAGPAHEHRLPIGREPYWLVRGGDWRGNPRGIETRVHTKPEFWVEDCADNQQKLAEFEKRG